MLSMGNIWKYKCNQATQQYQWRQNIDSGFHDNLSQEKDWIIANSNESNLDARSAMDNFEYQRTTVSCNILRSATRGCCQTTVVIVVRSVVKMIPLLASHNIEEMALARSPLFGFGNQLNTLLMR